MVRNTIINIFLFKMSHTSTFCIYLKLMYNRLQFRFLEPKPMWAMSQLEERRP